MDDNIAIEVKNVYKNFRLSHEKADSVKSLFVNPFSSKRKKVETQHALKKISFAVEKGEFFGIVGRNGSGKSTLLKIIAGIYQPNKGSVKTNGRLVPFIELGVGFNPELTGRENVYLNGALLGFSEKEVDKKYKSIVCFAELEDFMDQKLKNYSSGMQVRLSFSVATVLAVSDILLIDEVLAVGDADFQRKCFEYFKKLKKDKKTVIFVSHDMSAIREYCDRVVLIENNKIIFSGSAEDVAQEYTKLFVENIDTATNLDVNKTQTKDNNSLSKWGSGGLDISNILVSKKKYLSDDDFVVFSYDITKEGEFSDKINPGFIIKNEQGQPICGTNTNISLKNQTITINNEKINVKWTIPNIFSHGIYWLDVAVLSASNGDTLQWWNEAESFKVVNEKNTPYPVSPIVKIDIS